MLGARSLALHFDNLSMDNDVHMGTPTFIPPDALNMPGYTLIASPTLYSGQTVHARVSADVLNSGVVSIALYLKHYGANDQIVIVEDASHTLLPDATVQLTWRVPDLAGQPIAEIGIGLKAKGS